MKEVKKICTKCKSEFWSEDKNKWLLCHTCWTKENEEVIDDTQSDLYGDR